MPEFIKKLKYEARVFLYSRSILALTIGLLVWPLLVFFVDLYDRFFPILETEAGGWLYLLVGLSALTLAICFVYFWKQAPKASQIAQDVERANPALMDSLNCAVELEEKAKRQALTFMEQRVVDSTNSRISSVAWGQGTRPGGRFWGSLLVGVICGFVLTVWSAGTSPVRKALDAHSDEPGLSLFTARSGSNLDEVFEASGEFTRGADISVFADITRGHRGQKQALIEFIEKGSGIPRMEMLVTPILGRFEFVVPSLTEPFEYRVVTPSLTSDWNKLAPYDPPSVKSISWNIQPPSYLKQSNFYHEGYGYIRAPEGSSIELALEVGDLPRNVSATLYGKDTNQSLEQGVDGIFRFSFTLDSEWKGQLVLADRDKPNRPHVFCEPVSFSPIPDDPPIVEITEPAKDLQLPADAQFLVEVYASDDHGVADVRIHISHAGEKIEETIFVEPVEPEKAQTYVFDLNDHPLAIGDVITYMALAMDNKEPEGQLARSEIYFIEVLPPEGNSTDSEGEGEGMSDTKEIPIRDFINKTKKIIRDSYDGLLEDNDLATEKLSLDIANDALSLKHEMTKVFDENEGMFPIVDGIDLGELLNEATYHIEQTEIFAGDIMLEDSLEPSEKTLRKLVQLYALLQKMNKKKQKGKSGKPSESTGESEEPKESEEETESQSEQLSRMADDLNKLQDLEDRQRELNREIGRAAGQGTQGAPNQKSALAQEDIRRDLSGLEDEWYERTGKLGDVAKLKQAGREMKEAAGDLRRDEPREAQPHGELAEEAMGSAISELQSKMAALAGSMVDQLSKGAGGLAESQRELQSETQGASPGKGDQLKGKQDQLNQSAGELLEQIDQMARSLGKFNENAMEDLLESARDSKDDGLERSGKRASNSLLYENFPSAEKEEGKVAENLEDLEESLEGVANKLRNLGNQELQELVENLLKAQDDLPGMGSEEMKESAKEIAQALGSMPNAKKNEKLLNLTQFFEQVAISEDPSQSKSMASAALSEAIQLAEQFFWKEAKENLLRRNQSATSAPSRYKRQVEEYFRRIAEGE
jgi:hypothetical protein